jgi:uroporphyrinogen decarboxylase
VPAEPLIVQALRGSRPERLPVWFMRQAGRSLPEYRATRAGTAMLDACLTPELAAEITLQPVRRHGVDAAVFFSDIVVPLRLAGVDVEIVPGRGPVFGRPVRDAADLADLVAHDLPDEAFAPIEEAVARTVAELGPDVPLLGFAGAPFTLAAYVVEGGPSKDHLRARTLMHADPEAWRTLTGYLARVSGAFLRAQVRAGARAVQLFDSWVGSLSEADYRDHVLSASAAALAEVPEVPRIHFGTGTPHLLPALRDAGADAIGVDHRIPLDAASALLGGDVPVQGNIDPALLGAPWPVLEAHLEAVAAAGRAAPAHVLNLGHGVPPETDPGVLTRIVEWAHGR